MSSIVAGTPSYVTTTVNFLRLSSPRLGVIVSSPPSRLTRSGAAVDLDGPDFEPVEVEVEARKVLCRSRLDRGSAVQDIGRRVVRDVEVVMRSVVSTVAGEREVRIADPGRAGRNPPPLADAMPAARTRAVRTTSRAEGSMPFGLRLEKSWPFPSTPRVSPQETLGRRSGLQPQFERDSVVYGFAEVKTAGRRPWQPRGRPSLCRRSPCSGRGFPIARS